MQTVLRDIRYAVRQIRKSPGFTFTAVVTLALGIGANTAIFSVVYRLLLESLPFHDAARIVSIFETPPQVPGGIEATYPDYQDWRTQQKSFEELAAYSTLNPDTVSLATSGLQRRYIGFSPPVTSSRCSELLLKLAAPSALRTTRPERTTLRC
jgi:hypothetical protein